MAGTVTVAESLPINGIRKVQWDWLDAGGVADKVTTEYYTGEIIFAAFDPDAGGTQPSNAYDVTVTDADSYDVLNAQGADLSNAANVYKTKEDKLGAVYHSLLTLNVSGAGGANGGIVTLLIR